MSLPSELPSMNGTNVDIVPCAVGFNGDGCHPTSVYYADKVIVALVVWGIMSWCIGMQYLGSAREVLLSVHREEHTKLAQLTENDRIKHKRSKTMLQSALDLWGMSNEQVAGVTGVDGGLYLTMIRGAAIFFGAYAGVGMVFLMPFYYSGNMQTRALFSFTIVNTSSSTARRWVVIAAQTASIAASYVFMFILWKRMQRFKFRAESFTQAFTEAHHTVRTQAILQLLVMLRYLEKTSICSESLLVIPGEDRSSLGEYRADRALGQARAGATLAHVCTVCAHVAHFYLTFWSRPSAGREIYSMCSASWSWQTW